MEKKERNKQNERRRKPGQSEGKRYYQSERSPKKNPTDLQQTNQMKVKRASFGNSNHDVNENASPKDARRPVKVFISPKKRKENLPGYGRKQ